MQSSVKFLVFVTYVNFVAAGIYPIQTNVPLDVNCGCIGFASLATSCGWPDKSCTNSSASFVNYQYWCKLLNQYFNDRRVGNTDANYARELTCDSNLSEAELASRSVGVVEPPSGPTFVQSNGPSIHPMNASIPVAVNWTSSMTPVKNQGNCNSCWAFVSTAICEWWYKNKSPPSVILSVS